MNPLHLEGAKKYITHCFLNNEFLTEEEVKLFIKAVYYYELHCLKLDPISLFITNIEKTSNQVGFYAGQMRHCYNTKKKKWEYKIIINQELIKKYLQKPSIYSLITILNTLLHEIRHYYQHTVIMRPFDISEPEAVLWYKEYHMGEMFKQYDDENYWQLFIERDARKSANSQVKNYLKKFNPELYTRYQFMFESYLKMRQKQYFTVVHKNPQKRYHRKNNAVTQITHYFSHYLLSRKQEERLELYKNYKQGEEPYMSPLFAFEYHEDGTKKTYGELMSEKNLLIAQKQNEYQQAYLKGIMNENEMKRSILREKEKIENYYKFIISTDKSLELSVLMERMNYDLQYQIPNTSAYEEMYQLYKMDIQELKKQIISDKKQYKNIYQSKLYAIKQSLKHYVEMMEELKKDLEELFEKEIITESNVRIKRIK